MLTQFVAVREIGSTFFSTELVALGAVAVTLIGPSLGYALSHRLAARLLAAWGVFSVAAHLLLPVGLRAFVGALTAHGFEAGAIGLTLVGGSLLLCGFYSVFLPRLAREPATLPRLYATELAGALAALAVLLGSPSWRFLLAVYWGVDVAVIHLGLGSRRLTAVTALAALAMTLSYPVLDQAAARAYFHDYYDHRHPEIVETAYSPYQRIDVIDDDDGRSLYLDGVPFFRAGDLTSFNVFLADVPGALHPGRGTALVIGSGSFSSAGYLKRLGYAVTVVELDAAVARLGFRHFAALHRLAQGDVRLVVNDGRRFLAATPPAAFDLVVLDVPAPYHVQTALLHTPAFYRLVASRLRPGGVAAISLCDDFEGRVGRSIAASAALVFPDLVVVESESLGLAILYGGAPLPFTADAVEVELLHRDPDGGRVLADAAVRRDIVGAAPLSEERLAAVLLLSRYELEDAFR